MVAPRASAQARLERRCPVCGDRFPVSYRLCPADGTPLSARPTTDPLIGQILGNSYRVLGPLAKGGMGRLYEAEHARLPRRLVVKVIHETFSGNPDAVARFEREARAVARIVSDHVLTVVDVVRTRTTDRPSWRSGSTEKTCTIVASA